MIGQERRGKGWKDQGEEIRREWLVGNKKESTEIEKKLRQIRVQYECYDYSLDDLGVGSPGDPV